MTAAQIISTDRNRALVGMGVTGRSVARYLSSKGMPFKMFDTRREPPGAEEFQRDYPEVDVHLGPLSLDSFSGCDEVVLSPGVAPDSGIFPEIRKRGVDLIGDIELFAREVNKPVIAITGSNAKSTVTTLVGEMASAAGLNVGVGGNLGIPALDLIAPERDLYVLELSSFQLETTHKLGASVACILNLSQDHMDRYENMLSYHRAKQRIYLSAQYIVCNRADALTMPLLEEGQKVSTFGLGCPDLKQFGLLEEAGGVWLSQGIEKLISADELVIKGRHNLANALAALAIGTAAGFPLPAMLDALRSFRGLPHRCQTLSQRQGVTWIDDSKATNTGAAIAALEGISIDRNIVLIAGGQAKAQDFDEFAKSIVKHVKQLILIGEDAALVGNAVAGLSDEVPIVYAVSMDAAVQAAFNASEEGDTVLLSPACASLDMFDSYEDRGKAFVAALEKLQ